MPPAGGWPPVVGNSGNAWEGVPVLLGMGKAAGMAGLERPLSEGMSDELCEGWEMAEKLVRDVAWTRKQNS